MNKSVLFVNWSQEDFAHPSLGGNDDHAMWDSQPFAIKSGEKIVLPEYLAMHFAKHLADRELYKVGLSFGSPQKSSFMQKCIKDPVEHESKLELEIDILNKNVKKEEIKKEIVEEEVKSTKIESTLKRGRPKKEIKKEEIKDEEFDGLNN